MLRPALRSGLGNPMSEMIAPQPKGLLGRNIKSLKNINRSNNHQFITWVESGQTKTASIGEMSHSGTLHDRGGLSKAGRALDKHGRRIDTVFPKATGNIHEKNMQGQRLLDEILNHPQKIIFFKELKRANNKIVLDVFITGKHGARFSKDGKTLIGFLEPLK